MNLLERIAEAEVRRQQVWAAHLKFGKQNVTWWRRQHPGRRIRPARFYKLMHDGPSGIFNDEA